MMIKDKVFIKWRDRISVGIPSIDDQHKVLIGIINTLFSQILEPQYGIYLDDIFLRLRLYAKEHFEYEESLLEKYNWPSLNNHKNEHVKLIKRLDALEFELLKCSDMQSSMRIMEFLKDWLQEHILKEDKQYSDFLIEKGAQ